MKRVETSIFNEPEALAKPADYKELKNELTGRTKKILVGDAKIATDAHYDTSVNHVISNHQKLHKALDDQITEINNDSQASNAEKQQRVLGVKKMVEQIERADMLALSAAAAVKKQDERRQVAAANKLADALFTEHVKNMSLKSKVSQYNPAMLGGSVYAPKAEVFIWACQAAAMAIDNPKARSEFLKSKVDGGHGLTLRQVLEENQGLFTFFDSSKKTQAHEQMIENQYLSTGIDYPETLGERIFLEDDENYAKYNMGLAFQECGIDQKDQADIMNRLGTWTPLKLA
jgi:hypothetical protein